MKKKEFLDVSREYFKSIGFQTLKKSKFYFNSKDIILMVWLNHSNFSEMYYVDYYIRIQKFHPGITEITNDKIWDTHFARITNGKDSALLLNYEELEAFDYIKILRRRTEEQIIPILQFGINYLRKIVANSNAYPQYYMFFTDEAKTGLLSLKA